MAIAIDRWHQALSLRGPQSAPQAARGRAEALARGAGPALWAALQPYLARHPGEVIRIRQLDVALALDLARPPDEGAPAYAAALARRIVDAIDDGGADVVRFADRATYRAAYAVALAAGDAQRRWVFDEFDGLALLPPGAAVRTLFEQEPARAWALLARLAREPAVFALLAGADALRVLDVLLDEAAHAAPPAALPRLPPPSVLACPAAAVLERIARAAAAGVPTDHALVAAALGAARSNQAAPDDASDADVRAGLASRLHGAAPTGHAAEVARTAPSGMVPSPDADTPALHAMVDQPCAEAGLVVLLDELDAWLDERFCAALPALEHGSARGAFALAALAAAGDAQRVWTDNVWRALLDVDARLDINELAAALEAGGRLDDAEAAATATAATAGRGATLRWRDAARVLRGVDAATGLWRAADDDAPPADRVRWRRARDDAAALDLPLLHALPTRWRALGAAAAQFAWRRAAWRVPGLRDASLPYLRRNLLGGDGSATRVADDHWHWRVARAPLHVLLALTTLGARERAWRGPPGRRLTLEFHG